MYHSFKRLSWVLEKPFEGTQQGMAGELYMCFKAFEKWCSSTTNWTVAQKWKLMFNVMFIFIPGKSNKGSSRSSRGNGGGGKKEDQLVSQSLIYQAGETANLPCDTSVPQNHAPNDELMLIMWYREDVRSPIYSIGTYTDPLGRFLPSLLGANLSVWHIMEDRSGKMHHHIRIIFPDSILSNLNSLVGHNVWKPGTYACIQISHATSWPA